MEPVKVISNPYTAYYKPKGDIILSFTDHAGSHLQVDILNGDYKIMHTFTLPYPYPYNDIIDINLAPCKLLKRANKLELHFDRTQLPEIILIHTKYTDKDQRLTIDDANNWSLD